MQAVRSAAEAVVEEEAHQAQAVREEQAAEVKREVAKEAAPAEKDRQVADQQRLHDRGGRLRARALQLERDDLRADAALRAGHAASTDLDAYGRGASPKRDERLSQRRQRFHLGVLG